MESLVLADAGWSMTFLMNPRLWLALVLALFLGFTHFTAYRSGRAAVRAQWDAQKVVDAAAAKKAEDAARQIESDRQKQAQEAIDESKKREAALRADAASARNALDRLRNAVRAASDVPSNPGNAIGGPATTAELLLECGAETQRLAEAADQHASDVKTLTEAWPK